MGTILLFFFVVLSFREFDIRRHDCVYLRLVIVIVVCCLFLLLFSSMFSISSSLLLLLSCSVRYLDLLQLNFLHITPRRSRGA